MKAWNVYEESGTSRHDFKIGRSKKWEFSAAASQLKVSRPTLSKIINGRAGISADMALRLEAFLRNPSEFWLDLQKQYDLAQAKRQKRPNHTTGESRVI